MRKKLGLFDIESVSPTQNITIIVKQLEGIHKFIQLYSMFKTNHRCELLMKND